MSTTKREDLLRKVKALLAKAGDESVTEAEAASFLAKANEMMVEYSISEYDLGCYQKSDLKAERLFDGKTYPMYHYMWNDLLIKHFHVKVLETGHRGRKVLVIYGTQSNIEWATYVWNFLIAKSHELWLRYKRYHPEVDNKDRGAYYTGLHIGLNDKLVAAKGPSNSRALVVLDNDLDEGFDNMFPGVNHQERTVVSHSEETREAGRQDGREINLARPISGSRNATALLS